jgi:SAM-dependent methyltransferase
MKTAEITVVPWEIGEAQPIVCKILDNISPGRLLDVGCGFGRNAKAAYDRGYDVVAIDTSENAIEKCRDFFSDARISFHVQDACNTELTPGFEVILDSATYHAIPQPLRKSYLTEMHRLSNEKTVFHLITFAPSLCGMPKPLASELSELASTVESCGWKIQSVVREEYKGNAAAIEDFQQKKSLKIQLDEQGRTRLPVWHVILKTSL